MRLGLSVSRYFTIQPCLLCLLRHNIKLQMLRTKFMMQMRWTSITKLFSKKNKQTTFSTSSGAANFILGGWCSNILLIDYQPLEGDCSVQWAYIYWSHEMEFAQQVFHFQILDGKRIWSWILKWLCFSFPVLYLLLCGSALCLGFSPFPSIFILSSERGFKC